MGRVSVEEWLASASDTIARGVIVISTFWDDHRNSSDHAGYKQNRFKNLQAHHVEPRPIGSSSQFDGRDFGYNKNYPCTNRLISNQSRSHLSFYIQVIRLEAARKKRVRVCMCVHTCRPIHYTVCVGGCAHAWWGNLVSIDWKSKSLTRRWF